MRIVFLESPLVKRETKSVNLDTFDDRNLFLDISQINERTYIYLNPLQMKSILLLSLIHI